MVSPREELTILLPEVSRLALEYVEGLEDPASGVFAPTPPAGLLQALGALPGMEGQPTEAVLAAAANVLHHSVRTGHPRFFNQLFGGVDPAGIAGEWLTAVLNTSMYTFEVAPALTTMETHLISRLNRLVGFDSGEGVFTPGGSIANLMALLAARQRAFPEAKADGFPSSERPVVFMSAEAHYSTPKAASVAGLGTRAVVSVPVDPVGRMVPEALDRAILQARSDSRHPMMVVATAGTTVAGAFDPIGPIAEIAARHGLWLHVDASFGGGVLFSPTHRHLVEGIHRADSVAWNPHKMMGLPLTCSVLLMRERGVLEATNGMQADYLFHNGCSTTPDLGDLSLQCGRRPDALKLWLSWLAQGDEGYRNRVDRLFELSTVFRQMVLDRAGFELVREPQGTNVCFRYLPPSDRSLTGQARRLRLGVVTVETRRRLLESGAFMINYAPVEGIAAFRIVLNNPRTSASDLDALFTAIERLAEPAPAPEGEAIQSTEQQCALPRPTT
jgi:glutamate/tyrosine decarboxylase-like PLP-dependent enzyme